MTELELEILTAIVKRFTDSKTSTPRKWILGQFINQPAAVAIGNLLGRNVIRRKEANTSVATTDEEYLPVANAFELCEEDAVREHAKRAVTTILPALQRMFFMDQNDKGFVPKDLKEELVRAHPDQVFGNDTVKLGLYLARDLGVLVSHRLAQPEQTEVEWFRVGESVVNMPNPELEWDKRMLGLKPRPAPESNNAAAPGTPPSPVREISPVTINGEEWPDVRLVNEGDYSKFEFFGESVPRAAGLTFQDLGGAEFEVWLPSAKKDWDDWDFAYAESDPDSPVATGEIEVAFRIEYDLEFWAKPYSISDLATAIETVLAERASSLRYWQKDKNTCIHGFGVSCVLPVGARIGDALAKEPELQELASAVKSRLEQEEARAIRLVFDFPPAIKSACEQYLLYFVQFLSDLGIQANAAIEEEANKVLFSVIPADEKEALGRIYEALQTYLGLPTAPDFAMEASRFRDMAVTQLQSNVLHLQSQLVLARAAIEMKNAALDAKDEKIALLQDRIDLREFQPKARPEKTDADKEELIKGVLSVKKYEFKFVEINIPELLRKLKRKFD
jgi:hypothetical protein